MDNGFMTSLYLTAFFSKLSLVYLFVFFVEMKILSLSWRSESVKKKSYVITMA